MQAQISLLLEEQTDQGLHCPSASFGKAILLNLKGDYSKFSGVRNFMTLTVVLNRSEIPLFISLLCVRQQSICCFVCLFVFFFFFYVFFFF